MFIAVEGIDGAGKTTLAKSLSSLLEKEGFRVFLTREPTDDIRNYEGDDVELFIKFTLDRYKHQKEIRKKLNEGFVVISDRYIRSSYAYEMKGAAAALGSEEKAKEWMDCVSNIITIRPDINILVQVDVQVGLDRISKRNGTITHFEQRERLNEALKIYNSFDWDIKVDGTDPLDKITNEVYLYLKNKIGL
ncbi:thymidylate kinase [Thermoplasma volcanium GSS1]|uniref:Probable thymidylate kinase n=1 Tax=Thermoplasma volcanium (strain ATCC 51530 / DSM 4299 / JCM 9571 / NBRC 15438 / GSS1) TaxID=273116 RepID=KTHY_THEVO|nr:dTMP kinase [Thermoplasma volcanium]Q97CC8.1 RecName: Full=Probable thymidylate kinase; AltName: Full=dTMP kinase [Thermoplasma volcanium GSS1]BAB59316.1 thymidylate kinase [Thermoplasma volcanium GSS1]